MNSPPDLGRDIRRGYGQRDGLGQQRRGGGPRDDDQQAHTEAAVEPAPQQMVVSLRRFLSISACLEALARVPSERASVGGRVELGYSMTLASFSQANDAGWS
jgi:hypothetical protein